MEGRGGIPNDIYSLGESLVRVIVLVLTLSPSRLQPHLGLGNTFRAIPRLKVLCPYLSWTFDFPIAVPGKIGARNQL